MPSSHASSASRIPLPHSAGSCPVEDDSASPALSPDSAPLGLLVEVTSSSPDPKLSDAATLEASSAVVGESTVVVSTSVAASPELDVVPLIVPWEVSSAPTSGAGSGQALTNASTPRSVAPLLSVIAAHV